ncbi:MAG TPA: DUF1501 domain-containing protein [Tepidisphaeraceae bacterium]|jgi:uncharacterized protein (DUF1501 family)|nr:DUF1501 domain-containing protein [Tepidisphaeraceae bacterium]
MSDHLSTRRAFLQNGLGLLAAATTVPAFLDRTVWAMDKPLDGNRLQRASGKDGKILVVVQLSGGNDGLNSVVPYADDAYYRARPAIGIAAKDTLRINDYIGLNPTLTPLQKMYDNGQLSIIQGVGYPNPNRSHFRSMDIWQTANPQDEMAATGWVGKFFDNTCEGVDPHVGVSIGENLPLAMKGERITPLAFERPDSYRYKGKDRERYLALNQYDGSAIDPAMASDAQHKPIIKPKKKEIEVATADQQLDFLRRTAMDAQVSSDRLLKITREFQAAGTYPRGSFGDGLRTVAAMIGGGLSTRVYYVTLGGFDTHAGQRGRHDNLMQQFAQGTEAFWADMLKQENSDRVLMLSFSEFGRRVQQNASGGTDHGAAAPMFVMGPKLKQGVIGKHPSLTDLDQGDLKHNIDFRSVYATVLEEWLETPSKPILGQQFKTLPMFKA